MFGNYFGHYLLEQGFITDSQFEEVSEAQKSARVKLGLLAVASGLLTQKQADRVNLLQQQMDKRFGDIAVEEGYLTKEQVDEMLSKQGDAYMTFVQAITDRDIMTLEELQDYVTKFQEHENYTDAEMDALKSGDLDRIVPIFLKEPALSKLHKDYVALTMRNLMRFVDTDIRMEQVVQMTSMTVKSGAQQGIFGDQQMFTSIFGEDAGILKVACAYGKEDFKEIDIFSLDAISEFLNVNNGLFVSGQSEAGIEMDLEPPEMYQGDKTASCEGIAYVIPVYLSGEKITVVFGINVELTLA